MTEKRFKSRCYEKEKNVVIYDEGNKLFDVSYRDFEDAFYLKMKLIPVIDKLNELAGENKQLKSDNFNLNKTVEYLNETVKEQCNKLDWASECSVRWEEEYTKWIGDLE